MLLQAKPGISYEMFRQALGDSVVDWFVRNKRAEWHSCRTRVTQWEIDQYLPLL